MMLLRNHKPNGKRGVCLTAILLAAVWVAMSCCMGATCFSQNTPVPNRDFRITQLPGDPVPLPTDGFSVRQINGLWHAGSYYVYADVIDWTNPKHPASYGSSIGVYSSPRGAKWKYHGKILSPGAAGEWDHGGTATPGAIKFRGKFYVAYSGREFPNGLGRRYIGLAVADNPLGPFTKTPGPIFPLVGHADQDPCFDDPQLVSRPGDDKLYLYYRYARFAKRKWKDLSKVHAVDYSVRLRTTINPEQGWSAPRIILTKQPGDGALEPVDAKWIDGQFVLASLNYNPGTALYVSADGIKYQRCTLPNLRRHVPKMFRPNPAAHLSGLLLDGQGKLRFVNTAGFTDSNGHYTQWIYPAKATRH